jgi:PPOX class probable F420-dependent enzyme
VPIAFAFIDAPDRLILYTALDEKRKSVADPRNLARVLDIGARPRVTVLVDHWDEDWSRLAWVRLEGTATVLEPTDKSGPEHTRAVGLLRARYEQYERQRIETRPVIRIAADKVSGWSA